MEPSKHPDATDRAILDRVVITEELERRPSRPADFEAEASAMRRLADTLAEAPGEILQRLAEEALTLCRAGSSGISIAESDGAEPIFRWHATAGQLRPFRRGTMPRDFSPCGVVLDRDCAQLMRQPIDYFGYIDKLGMHLEEVLLVPFYRHGKPIGTIWVIRHEVGDPFDAEDRRMLTSLAHFTAGGWQAYQLLEQTRASEVWAQEERRYLFEVLMQAPVAVAVLEGPLHMFALANPLYRKLVNGRDVVGKPLLEALPEARGYGFDALLDRVKQTGEPLHVTEAEMKLDDAMNGRALIVNFTYAPLRRRDGVNSVIAVLLDVTEEVYARRAADAAARREATARGAVEQALAGREFLLQTAAALGAGLDRRTLIERLLATIVPSQADMASLWTVTPEGRCDREAFAGFDATSSELRVEQAEAGSDFPVLRVARTREVLVMNDLPAQLGSTVTSGPLVKRLALSAAALVPLLHGDEVIAVLSLARSGDRPFTDREVEIMRSVGRQAGLALENARLHHEASSLREMAELATAAKDVFLARVSHDLRNPLGSILGWTNLLSEGTPSAAQLARGLEVIERNAHAQVQLIDDLLDVSRITEGKLHLDLSSNDVAAIVHEALEPSLQLAEKKGVRIDIQVDADAGSVVVDPSRFRQVLWNLASNAVKFTPAHGTVSILAKRDRAWLNLTVADTGVGIAPEFLPKIFATFEQASSSGARTGGLGLGLAIARHIVELHGGTIAASSPGNGQGSVFTLRLPLR